VTSTYTMWYLYVVLSVVSVTHLKTIWIFTSTVPNILMICCLKTFCNIYMSQMPKIYFQLKICILQGAVHNNTLYKYHITLHVIHFCEHIYNEFCIQKLIFCTWYIHIPFLLNEFESK
jgi:hypothetical protein